jgi:predicted dehydrogenase
MPASFSRRRLLQASVLGAVAPWQSVAAEKPPAPNDRVNIGLIGCGRRGDNYLAGGMPPRVQVVATCDVHRTRAEQTAQRVGCRDVFQDFRRILDRKDIEGVMIATPDHWHALMAIAACQAGKHVYVEKPMAMCVVEGRRMVEAARKYRRIVQVGSQQRSTVPNRDGCAFVRSGGIGKVKRAITSNLASPWICDFAPQPIPTELDWDQWCGPSPVLPFHPELFACEGKPGWMEIRDYSVGRIGNWGAHAIDQVQWALGMDATGPVEVRVNGEPLDPPRYREPEARERGWQACQQPSLTFHYASGTSLELSHGPLSGAIFEGDKGRVVIERGSIESDPKSLIENVRVKDGPAPTQAHINNWLDCMNSGKLPVADVEIGHRTVTVCHLGNIARQLGRNLKWNPATERFDSDDAANQLLDRPRRKGFELPSSV